MEPSAPPHPLVDVIARLVSDTNRMWAEGDIPDCSAVRLVVPDLVAAQYAPHYPDGVWTAESGTEWIEFLETWRRDGDGQWRLARHTAEKT